MNGFLKASFTLQQCQEKCENIRFPAIDFGVLSEGLAVLGKRKIVAVYLYSTAVKKPYMKLYQPKAKNGVARQQENVAYDRFHLFGNPNTPHVFIVFTETPAISGAFLRFGGSVSPGTEVFILMPSIKVSIQNTPSYNKRPNGASEMSYSYDYEHSAADER